MTWCRYKAYQSVFHCISDAFYNLNVFRLCVVKPTQQGSGKTRFLPLVHEQIFCPIIWVDVTQDVPHVPQVKRFTSTHSFVRIEIIMQSLRMKKTVLYLTEKQAYELQHVPQVKSLTLVIFCAFVLLTRTYEQVSTCLTCQRSHTSVFFRAF